VATPKKKWRNLADATDAHFNAFAMRVGSRSALNFRKQKI
jgi:hypothetical protein